MQADVWLRLAPDIRKSPDLVSASAARCCYANRLQEEIKRPVQSPFLGAGALPLIFPSLQFDAFYGALAARVAKLVSAIASRVNRRLASASGGTPTCVMAGRVKAVSNAALKRRDRSENRTYCRKSIYIKTEVTRARIARR